MLPRQVEILDLFLIVQMAIPSVWNDFLQFCFKKEDVIWDAEDNFLKIDGVDIPRPNHGMPHSLRVAALVILVVMFKKDHVDPTYQSILDAYDKKRIKFLVLAAFFSVVGRKDEVGFNTVVKDADGNIIDCSKIYLEYRQASADAFEKFCKANQTQLEMTDADIRHYAYVVKHMGNHDIIELYNDRIKKDPNSCETLFDLSILHLAHCLDLFRCADHIRMKNSLETHHELYDKFWVGDYKEDFDDLISTAIRLITKTGDRLLSSYEKGIGVVDKVKPYHGSIFKLVALHPTEAMQLVAMQVSSQHWTSVVNEKNIWMMHEFALKNLQHGPRDISLATHHLQTFCNNLLSNESFQIERNLINELVIHIPNVLMINLYKVLLCADFEHLSFTEEQIEAYVRMLRSGNTLYSPKFGSNNHFPTEQDYQHLDPDNELSALHYGEKLAITLYTDDGFYGIINTFLRSCARYNELPSHDLGQEVKELILAAVMASSGIVKLNALEKCDEERYILVRVEDASDMHVYRQGDILLQRVTDQRGF